jgi:hypothetical protein
MRYLAFLLALAALAVPASATAKSWITLSGAAGGVTAGEPWRATLRFPLHPDAGPLPRRPELVFTHFDTYEQRRFQTTRMQMPGVFRARVTLNRPGKWTVYVYASEVGAVSPGPGAPEVVVRAADESGPASGLLWAGALALCVLAVVATTTRRRRARRAPFRASPAARA